MYPVAFDILTFDKFDQILQIQNNPKEAALHRSCVALKGQMDNFGVTSKSHIVDFRLIHFKFSMAFETISCLETLTFDGFSNR